MIWQVQIILGSSTVYFERLGSNTIGLRVFCAATFSLLTSVQTVTASVWWSSTATVWQECVCCQSCFPTALHRDMLASSALQSDRASLLLYLFKHFFLARGKIPSQMLLLYPEECVSMTSQKSQSHIDMLFWHKSIQNQTMISNIVIFPSYSKLWQHLTLKWSWSISQKLKMHFIDLCAKMAINGNLNLLK